MEILAYLGLGLIILVVIWVTIWTFDSLIPNMQAAARRKKYNALGAVVGYVYPNTFAAVFTAAGFPALAAVPLWQVGGVLGFIGGFFRSHLKQADKN